MLATHSGSFHLDDCFAYAVLRLALDLVGEGDHRLVRTRDAALLATADIVWDVGAVFDPAAARFDHHQRGAPVRAEDGLPYSAAGLIWRAHGEAAVRAVLSPAGAAALAPAVAAEIDRTMVRRIDAIDNGIGEPGDALCLSGLTEDHNPAWDSPESGDRAAEDAAFLRAAAEAEAALRRRIGSVRAALSAAAVVREAHARSADPRILELDRKLPWEGPAHEAGLPTLYAVYPVATGNWMVDAMPIEAGAFAQRLPLPESWAGLRDEALAAVCGVPDAVFVHARQFVGAARSREGAMEMARRAIALGGASAPPG